MNEYSYDNFKTNQKPIGLCVITHPFPSEIVGHKILSDLIKVLEPVSNEIFVITGISTLNNLAHKNNIHIINVTTTRRPHLLSIIKYILAQVRMSIDLIKVTKKIDIVIFFLCVPTIPVLAAFLLKKKIVTVVTGSSSKSAEWKYASYNIIGKIYFNIMKVLERVNYTLSDCIVVYSKSIISQLGLEKYRNKIQIAHRHFLDFDKFRTKKKFNERANLVGYIGRLSEEKGVMNFVDAIPLILKELNSLEFVIGGDGTLLNKIKEKLKKSGSYDKVTITGWIPHDGLPEYLNELKLLVLPSYTEGLPNVVLEAMTCGTPVLATPVGGVPDLIKDGETGFIMEDNSPECIAENAIRVLNYLGVEQIVKNARELVGKEFTYEAARARYKKILEGI